MSKEKIEKKIKEEIELDPVTADTIAKEFKEHSVAEFFKKNKQMLGLYGKVRTLTTIIHEYVSNSLDACEEANILPEIEVKLDELGEEYYEATVKDNGPGLTEETVGKAFGQLLAGTKFHRMMQARGQQGIGASGCTMLSQSTTGKATKVITGKGDGKVISLELTIDPKMNQAKITNFKKVDKEYRGTAVQAKFKGVIYKDTQGGVLEYLRRTAIANPHAQIKFRDPKGQTVLFKRTLTHIPKKPKEMKPHPLGTTVDDLVTMSKYTESRKAGSFLKNEFDRVGDTSLQKIQNMIRFDLNKDPHQLSWEECEQLIQAFKKVDFIAPSTEGLSPIGEDRIKKSLESIVKPEFVVTLTRKPKIYAGGYSFQIEVGLAYGGNAGERTSSNPEDVKVELMRYANRAPLLFDGGSCAITKAIQSVEWKRYGVRDLDSAPLAVFINFISVHVPYTGAGKQAITDEEEIMEELRLSLMDCGRRMGIYLGAKRREHDRKMKQEMFYKYIPEIATALSSVTKEKKETLITKLEKLVKDKLGLEKLEAKIKSKQVGKEEQEKADDEIGKAVVVEDEGSGDE
ncbi:MAG: DNA topoisomerase VI subunit B [Candidatus Diapherotrites archaeon]|nr:DNA topoisomerase VI subunit B [Candidatus Diapherotrites archaeon]